MWDARTGKCVQRFDHHESEVTAVRFYPSGEALATACGDGTVSHTHVHNIVLVVIQSIHRRA